MSTGGSAQNDAAPSCIPQNEAPSPSAMERLKSEADAEAKPSSAEGGRLKFFIGLEMIYSAS